MLQDHNIPAEIVDQLSIGWAYHREIYDEDNSPVDYVFLEVNDQFEKITGLKKENIIEKKITNVLRDIENSSFDWIQFYREIALKKKNDFFEKYSEKLEKWYGAKVFSRKKGYFAIVFYDITERKEKEKKLHKKQKRIKNIFDNSSDVIWSMSWPDLEMRFISKSVKELIGYKTEDFKENYRFMQQITHPEDKKINKESLKKLKEKGYAEREFRIICKDGNIKWVQDRNKLVYNEENKPVRVEGVMRDITEKVKQRKELEMMNFTIDNSDLLIFRTTPKGIIDYVNETAIDKLEYKKEELIGEHVKRFLKSDNYIRRDKFWKKVKNNTSMTYERKITTKSGKVFPAEMTSQYFKYENKEYEFAFVKDITEKKRNEKVLKKSQEIANLGNWEFDLKNNKLFWSDVIYRIFGLKPQEFEPTYEAFLDTVHPEDRKRVDDSYISSVKEKKDGYEIDHRIIKQDTEEVRYVKEKCEHIKNNNGETVRSLGVVQDITERKAREKKIKEKNNKIKKLYEINLQLAETQNVKEACKKTVEATKDILDFDLCHISLVEDGYFVLKASTSKTESFKRSINIGLAGKSYHEGKSFIVDNAQKNPDVAPIKESFKSAISIPLGEHGIFQAISKKEGAFTEQDLELSELLVSQTTKRLNDIYSKEKLIYQSYHDSLTGLYNRRFFVEKLKKLDYKNNLPISIIMLDINGLKIINDSYGHKNGDELLIKTARILEKNLRDNDILAKIGGDEFILLLPQTDNEKAHDIFKSIKNVTNKTKDDELPVSLGGGISTKKNMEQSIEDIWTKADDNMLQNKLVSNKSKKNEIVNSILNSLGAKSDETKEHAMRMTRLAQELGEKLGISNSELDRLSLLASLHDIGKTSIPENILNKKSALSDEEWEMMKKHTTKGYRIASATEEFAVVAEEILSHHERWDGSGYPNGLTKKDTPYLARIISIVDAYDVMTNDRPYSKAISNEEALAEIDRFAGSQFDPELAEEFIELKSKNK